MDETLYKWCSQGSFGCRRYLDQQTDVYQARLKILGKFVRFLLLIQVSVSHQQHWLKDHVQSLKMHKVSLHIISCKCGKNKETVRKKNLLTIKHSCYPPSCCKPKNRQQESYNVPLNFDLNDSWILQSSLTSWVLVHSPTQIKPRTLLWV